MNVNEFAYMNPKKRSRLRLMAGRALFRGRRYWQWWTGNARIARVRREQALRTVASSHHTPLLRKLRAVDMQLQYNKIVNLKIAVSRLDGLTVNPGETLSYWRTIGKPTKRKGYQEGMVLFNGGFRSGTGGGLCQLSNLIYWMTLHTPLTVTERHRHSYDVFPDEARTQPFGSGATCAYNYLDLQIRNDTETPYQLKLWLSAAELHGEWRTTDEPLYSYEIYEAGHRISLEPWGGYVRRNEIRRRTLSRSGEIVGDESVAVNAALMMYAPLLDDVPSAP